MSDDLKPCPFCNCQDVDGQMHKDGRIHCYRCGANGPTVPYARDDKFPTWNTRATDPRIEALERERDGNRKVASEYEKRLNDEWRVRIAAEAALAAMTAERDEWQASWQEVLTAGYAMKARAEAAEARLAKAVEALRMLVEASTVPEANICITRALADARATLAEIGGEDDAG